LGYDDRFCPSEYYQCFAEADHIAPADNHSMLASHISCVYLDFGETLTSKRDASLKVK
jgi:hypothetical protein